MLYVDSITTIDNFLEASQHLNILNTTNSSKFPWNRGTILPNNLYVGNPNSNLHFVHKLVSVHHRYIEDTQVSHDVTRNEYYPIIEPIVDKLQISSLLRAQINLTPNTGRFNKAGFHVDVSNSFLGKGMTAIYYINTNNGFTEFSDGTIVKSIENRICVFPNNMLHTGVSSTNTSHRLVLNLNWLSKATGRI
jgi:hypothetical protein